MNDLTLNILGFPAVNRDLTVELRDPLTQNVVRTVKPFLDGTVRVPKIDRRRLRGGGAPSQPSAAHPHAADPRAAGRRHQGLGRDRPVEVPQHADRGHARRQPRAGARLAASVAETVLPLANKVPGEAIRSRRLERDGLAPSATWRRPSAS